MNIQTTTPAIQQMIDNMTVRHFSPKTQAVYLRWIVELANYYQCPAEQLNEEQLKQYLWQLRLTRHLSVSTCRQALHALLFFYQQILNRPMTMALLPPMKSEQRIPDLLSPIEVRRSIDNTRALKYQTIFRMAYGGGLRVGEIVALKVCDIDGSQHTLHVRQGKGGKDRLVPMSQRLLHDLRIYWLCYRPGGYLFCTSRDRQSPVAISTVQKTYTLAKRTAGIAKSGGIHALRHAFATHQLAQGMPLAQLQKILGHKDIRTTLRYTHWLPNYQATDAAHFDLIANLETLK